MFDSNVGESSLKHRLSKADYAMRKRQKKQGMRKRTKSSRNLADLDRAGSCPGKPRLGCYSLS